jgi:hypothetical protein
VKTFLHGVVVLAFFMAFNALFAILFLGIFKLGKWAAPSLIDEPWFSYPLGLVALGLGLWSMISSVRIITSPTFQSRVQALVRGLA